MKIKKIPMRTCIVTGEKLPKIELLRIVRSTEGEVIPDLTGKINGRGAYIKKDQEVLEKAKNKKILERKIETSISEEIYEKISEIIREN